MQDLRVYWEMVQGLGYREKAPLVLLQVRAWDLRHKETSISQNFRLFLFIWDYIFSPVIAQRKENQPTIVSMLMHQDKGT